MKKRLHHKKIVTILENIFYPVSNKHFYIGMTNPKSLYESIINHENFQLKQRNLIKKANQRKAGLDAQQDGENVKNELASKLSYKGDLQHITPQAIILAKEIGINIEDIIFIGTKAHADGKIACAKSDLKSRVELKNNTVLHHQISLKSTFAKTQVAVHSMKTFEQHLKNIRILLPEPVKEFLTHFTYSNNHYLNKPIFSYSESRRRERYNWEEINNFNPNLWLETQLFFEKYAEDILYFLISRGSETNIKNHANLLAFCDKKLNNLIIVNIKKLIAYIIDKAKLDNSFCLKNKPRAGNGTTTFSLYAGLISFQMKGSGKGAAYHALQFNISGSTIKKIKDFGLIG